MSNIPPPPMNSPSQWPAPSGPAMGSQPKAKKPMWWRKRVILPVGFFGLIIVAVALTGGGSSNSTETVIGSTDTTVAAASSDESLPDASTETTIEAPTETTATPETTEATAVEASEADDITGCTRIDESNIRIDAINNSSKTSSYWLTVAYFDDAGARVADSTSFLNNLRPNEQAAEVMYVFESDGTTCEVIDVNRTAAESNPDEMAEISECVVSGGDVFGHAEASVTATNGSSETSDYAVDVAFIQADGIRVGNGIAYIEAVRPGESAPSGIFGTTVYDPALTCEVVAVTRNANI